MKAKAACEASFAGKGLLVAQLYVPLPPGIVDCPCCPGDAPVKERLVKP